MKTFRVWAKCISYCYVDVQAETENDAIDKANGIDGGDFINDDRKGSFETSYIEQL